MVGTFIIQRPYQPRKSRLEAVAPGASGCDSSDRHLVPGGETPGSSPDFMGYPWGFVWVFSPHLCVGFLFLVMYSRPPPPHTQHLPTYNLLTHHSPTHTHTTYSHTHTTFPHTHTTYSHTTYTQLTHTQLTHTHTQLTHTHNLPTHHLLTYHLPTHTTYPNTT